MQLNKCNLFQDMGVNQAWANEQKSNRQRSKDIKCDGRNKSGMVRHEKIKRKTKAGEPLEEKWFP